ncbi:unnamed protein product [Closterium sp. NIES-64]|nr:unnamed protein product [Closterium sp. NIES-64]
MSSLGTKLGQGLGRNAEEDGGGADKAREFLAGRPQVEVATGGGRIEVWGAGLKRLEDADVSAAVMTIEPESMALPMYSNDEEVSYVVEGEARAGLISPEGIRTNVSHRVLAKAWGVKEADVAQLLQGQKDIAIAKVDPGKVVSGDPDADEGTSAASATDNSEGTVAFGDFVYNLIEEQASIETPGGGTLTTADGFKLPVFQHLGVSAARIDLLPNAMAAPRWLSNSAAVHFVTRGSGRFEIAYPDGRKALRKRVNAGDVVVVPAAFAHAVEASGEGLEYVALSPKSKPKPGFLAGGNSVYSALPTAVLKAAFNVDEALAEKLRGTREGEYVILSPGKGKGDGGA